jgi:hypothetical protein
MEHKYHSGGQQHQMIRQKFIPILISLGLTLATLPADRAISLAAGQKEQKEKPGKKENKKKSDDEAANGKDKGRPVMWEEPKDIRSRDLFYGPGGKEGMPELAKTFIFKARKTTGTSEKMEVEDNLGRKWVVKFGSETRAETAASRIVWAVGYHADQDYFVKRASIQGRGGFDVANVRFERDDDGFKSEGNWDWHVNPFKGTKELDGLKVMMALIKNWDLKADNNKVVRLKKKSAGGERLIHYVSDVGASLGNTGSAFNEIGLFKDFPADRAVHYEEAKGNPESFAAEPFITGTQNGEVLLFSKRKRCQDILKGVRVENARWIGGLLAQLSDEQLRDAFRAGGFSDAEVSSYVKTMKERIRQLQELR